MTQDVPRGWYPDPTRQHDLRFWDGDRWTTAVAQINEAGDARISDERSRAAGAEAPARAPLERTQAPNVAPGISDDVDARTIAGVVAAAGQAPKVSPPRDGASEGASSIDESGPTISARAAAQAASARPSRRGRRALVIAAVGGLTVALAVSAGVVFLGAGPQRTSSVADKRDWDEHAGRWFDDALDATGDVLEGKNLILDADYHISDTGVALCKTAQPRIREARDELLPVPRASRLGQSDRDDLASVLDALLRGAKECHEKGWSAWKLDGDQIGAAIVRLEDAFSRLNDE